MNTYPTGKLVEVGSCPESHGHIRALIAVVEDERDLSQKDCETLAAARKFLEENNHPQMCVFSTKEQLQCAVMPLFREVVVVPIYRTP